MFKYPYTNLLIMKGFNIVINEEELNGKSIFIARCLNLDVSSQGRSYEEAEKNIKEAIHLYIKTYPDALQEIPKKETYPPMLTKIFL